MAGNYKNIPEELRRLPRWVGFDKNKKPIDPQTGFGAKADDPQTWGTFEEALSLAHSGGAVGVGFELGDGYIGVDVDHCIIDGALRPEAAEIVKMLPTYAEKSISGTGLHFIYRGSLPDGHKRKRNFGAWAVEMYSGRRYFTMTGDVLDSLRRSIADATDAGLAVYDKFIAPEQAEPARGADSLSGVPALSDSAVMSMLLRRPELALLYGGDTTQYNGDSSAADMALCNALAFYCAHNAEQMDRLFRASGLMRDKWDEKHSADGRTYGQITIAEAVRTQNAYDPKSRPAQIAKSIGAIPPAEGFNAEDLLRFPLDDGGNAARINTMFGGSFLKALEVPGWYYWDGKRWKYDERGTSAYAAAWAMARCFQGVAAKRLSEAEDAAEDLKTDQEYIKAKAVHSFASKCGNVAKIENAVTALGQLEHVRQDKLDRNSGMLNCLNGTVDLQTGEIKPHSRNDYITQLVGFSYVPGTAAPTFEKLINDVFEGDAQLIEFFQRFIGYAATGETREQCFAVLYGTGANGKSTLMNAIGEVLREYVQTIQTAVLMEADRRGSDASPELASAKNKRLMLASESKESQRLNESQVKQLTGGETIFARPLYSAGFEYRPTFKIVLSTNHKPWISGADIGIWRRIKLIPFNRSFTAEEQDKELPRKLEADYTGILAWVVEGARKWYAGGLPKCPAVEASTEEYKGEMDTLQDFIDECTASCSHQSSILSQELYRVYCAWTRANGAYCISAKMFKMRLDEKGIHRTDSRPPRYLGMKLSGCGVQYAYGITPARESPREA